MVSINDFYLNIEAADADQLADHIDDLIDALEANPGAWENVTLDRYLGALAAVFRDHQNALLKGYVSGSIPYALVAHMLQAATIYE